MDKITPFELNRQQTNTKFHSNLSKYKDRHKQATIDNLSKKDQKYQFKYLEENDYQGFTNAVNHKQSQIIPEIKLFGDTTLRNK